MPTFVRKSDAGRRSGNFDHRRRFTPDPALLRHSAVIYSDKDEATRFVSRGRSNSFSGLSGGPSGESGPFGAVPRSASGSYLMELNEQQRVGAIRYTDSQSQQNMKFRNSERDKYKTLPIPPHRDASLAASAQQARQPFIANGMVRPVDRYYRDDRQYHTMDESNFHRNGRYRKSAMRSIRKWMRNRFKSSKSAPDGFQERDRPDRHSGHRRPPNDNRSFVGAYPPRSWERTQNMPLVQQRPSMGNHRHPYDYYDLQKHQHGHYQRPENEQRLPPPTSSHPLQLRSGISSTNNQNQVAVNGFNSSSRPNGVPEPRSSPDDHDSGVETPSTSNSEKPLALLKELPTPCLMGIRNHGNTCYINAVLQCLSATDPLASYLITEKFVKDLEDQTHAQQKIRRQFGTNGAMTRGLAIFMQKLWLNRYAENDSREFKTLIGQYSEDYRTSSQQDAQEFLVWLLDKVHEDLNTATKRTYRQSGRVRGSEENLADDARNNHRRAHCSFVTNLFEGQFRSSVFCPDCHNVKLNFDPYMCVSLPVPQDTKKPLFVTLVFLNRSKRLLKLGLNADVTAKLVDVKNCLKIAANVNPNEVILCELSNTGFGNMFSDDTDVTVLGSANDKTLYAIETPALRSPSFEHNRHAVEGYYRNSLHDSMKSVSPEELNVIFCHAVGSGSLCRRSGYPFVVRIDREMTYERLCRTLLSTGVWAGNGATAENMVPLTAFRIRVADEYAAGVYLDGAVTMPLYTQDVENALHYGNSSYASHVNLRLVIEWDPSTKHLYLDDGVTETIEEHQSCADLLDEMRAPAATLMQCFKEYTQTEVLEEWKCDNCKRRQRRAEKSLLFLTKSLPDVLVVHFKRFRHLPDGETVKLDPMIEFPIDSLNLSLFTHQPGNTPVPHRRSLGGSYKSANENRNVLWGSARRRTTNNAAHYGSKSLGENALYVNTEQNQNLYDLYAVVNHKGESINSGHYTAFCRNPVDGQWRHFDDTHVQHVDAKRVVSQSAYLLFYERRGSSRTVNCRSSSESGFSDHWFYRLPVRVVNRYFDRSVQNPPPSSSNGATPRPSRPVTPSSLSVNTLDDENGQAGLFNRKDAARNPQSPTHHRLLNRPKPQTEQLYRPPQLIANQQLDDERILTENLSNFGIRQNGEVRKPVPLPRSSLVNGNSHSFGNGIDANTNINSHNHNNNKMERRNSQIRTCSSVETDL